MRKVYVVYRYNSGDPPDIVSETMGVFSDRQRAIEACTRDTDSVVEFVLDHRLGDEKIGLETYYPIQDVTVPGPTMESLIEDGENQG